MNILGQPFAPWVTEQIKVRQKSLGNSTNLTNDNLLYQNGKTPWIRLASTVDIKNMEDSVFTKLLKFGFSEAELLGDNVAQNFILQGGVTGFTSTPPTNYVERDLGIVDTVYSNSGLNSNNKTFKGAYGWGGIEPRGYIPMPGITSADVQYYNNGALSKATVKMKCFSRNQLSLLDVLYMRPGYNLLLEFGWSQYLDNKGMLQSYDNFFSPALGFVFNPYTRVGNAKPSHFDVLDLIQKERISRAGNYEGVFGKVTNFHWSFNPDGSYDCSVNLIGMGDMMESLKVNIKLPSKADEVQNLDLQMGEFYDQISGNNKNPGEQKQQPLVANKNKTSLNKILYGLYEQSAADSGIGGASSDTFSNLTISKFPFSPVVIEGEQKTTSVFEDLIIKNGILSLSGVETDEKTNASPTVYISFGSLLALIQKHLLVYNTGGVPLFDFDVDFKNIETDENYICKFPGQFSGNPSTTLIPYTNPMIPGAESGENVLADILMPGTTLNLTMAKINPSWEYQTYLGRLMHVYLSIGNIANILDKTKRDDDGGLTLLTLLNSIISSMQKALGGVNMISIKVDEPTGKIKFIENTPQRFDEEKSDLVYAKFNTFGVKPDTEGSFVRNIVMGGELGPKYAAMIVIGSQISGNKLTANATGFANYNKGLVDRVIPTKINAIELDQGTEEESKKSEKITISGMWNDQINKPDANAFMGLFYSVWGMRKFLTEDLTTLTELNIQYQNLISGRLVEEKQLQTPSFLPFNLSLDIDGLSGIRLFEKFTIDDAVLPPSYAPDSIDLLAKSVNHMVSGEAWITQIDTIAAPRSKMNPIKAPSSLSSVTTTQKSTTGTKKQAALQPGEVKSLTSGYPMAKIFYDGPTAKNQIYIHHTAGHTKSPARTIKGWSKRTDHVATHYITNNLGDKEQLFADEAWANHLGLKKSVFKKYGVKYQNFNKTSLGIEMQCMGPVKLRGGVYYTYPNDFHGSTISASKIGKPVGKNGEFIAYKGYTLYENYNAANIAHVKTIVTGWMNKYSIPFHYDYDELFPNKGDGISIKALKGTPGVYTHNSIRTDKSDIWPQAELIAMLKSIATSGA